MRVKEIMTKNPACCVPETPLPEVARMFLEHDCGAIPVIEDPLGGRPVGVITDRDLACRAIAMRKNALEMTARECMSSPGVTIREKATLEECCETMEKEKVRRLLVVDEEGRCCGIVSQADIALNARPKKAAELLREISHPSSEGATLPAR
jgi:CBS domain-containing protein